MPQRQTIARTELFGLLGQGHGARVTVVTPNLRLAQALQRDFDRGQQRRCLPAWESADILTLAQLGERLWDEALHSAIGAEVPLLLTLAQEQALWDESVRAARLPDVVFSAESAAAQCRQAWRLVHEWRLDPRAGGEPNADLRAYLDWASRYERATRQKGQTDAARLPDVVARHLGHAALRKPATLALCGFDIVTPQAEGFVAALAAHGSQVVEVAGLAREGRVARVELAEPRDEIEAAARWARSRLEADAGARIGVVVPDLERERVRVRRVFASVMRPGHALGADAAALPFNLSLGAPLADIPLAADALLVLALAGPEIGFEEASRLVRSPFVGGAEREMESRARFDFHMRERAPPALGLDTLLRLVRDSRHARPAHLLDLLAEIARVRREHLAGKRNAAEWAQAFSLVLHAAGFPGERALDSAEHQALDRWNTLLAEFATLERVTGRMGYADACRRIAAMAREAIFQPEAGEVPVQVMGVLESAGLEFDHLWVMGLTDDAWPLPARPNAFLPVRMQRAARIPQADPGTSLELDRRITAGWIRAADEVVFSHARLREESELAPSPLIAALPRAPVEAVAARAFAGLREAIRRAALPETLEDASAPAIAASVTRGGTGLFKDQAACPFRAFAARRLDARPLESPRPGLDARDRGNLLHDVLAAAWKEIGTRERLVAMADRDRDALLGCCAEAAIDKLRGKRAEALRGRFARLEHARLVRLCGEWLAGETRRDDFTVIATEEKRPMSFGGVTVEARIDRMDRLANGVDHAIIDYKTGNCATALLLGARPDEPQLPMYALGSQVPVAAVAFGQVRVGAIGFKGLAREAGLVPGVVPVTEDRSRAAKRYRGWDDLVEGWRAELEAIGRAFAAGDARVDPKKPDTCKNCNQHTFCRIAEKAPFGVVKSGEPDE